MNSFKTEVSTILRVISIMQNTQFNNWNKENTAQLSMQGEHRIKHLHSTKHLQTDRQCIRKASKLLHYKTLVYKGHRNVATLESLCNTLDVKKRYQTETQLNTGHTNTQVNTIDARDLNHLWMIWSEKLSENAWSRRNRTHKQNRRQQFRHPNTAQHHEHKKTNSSTHSVPQWTDQRIVRY